MDALRQHAEGAKPFGAGSVSSVCMHYGGLVGDHTTASMVVSLEKDRTVVWSTGSSLPCVSLFKPWLFGTETVLPVIRQDDRAGEQYWLEAEQFRRKLLGKKLPAEFYAQRDEIQRAWIAQSAQISAEEFAAFSRKCLEEERTFFEKWQSYEFDNTSCSAGFRKRWDKKTKVLFPVEFK